MNQTVLVIDDDIPVAEGIASALTCAGRTIFTCNDAESAEVLLEWVTPSAIVCDVRLAGPFRYEGLDFLDHVARRSPLAAVLLMSGDLSPELRAEANRRGARAVLQKPFAKSDEATAYGRANLGDVQSHQEGRWTQGLVTE